MYLYRKTYVKNWDFMKDDQAHQITVKFKKKEHPFINPKHICYITEEVGYWRKANAIHNWFVKNCQDGVDNCGEHSVSLEQLNELLNTCKKVKENPSNAQELLPPQSGFFFGSTNIGEGYFRDIDNTINILEPLVKLGEDHNNKDKAGRSDYPTPYYIYQSSW